MQSDYSNKKIIVRDHITKNWLHETLKGGRDTDLEL